jgi:hypothetical protein
LIPEVNTISSAGGIARFSLEIAARVFWFAPNPCHSVLRTDGTAGLGSGLACSVSATATLFAGGATEVGAWTTARVTGVDASAGVDGVGVGIGVGGGVGIGVGSGVGVGGGMTGAITVAGVKFIVAAVGPSMSKPSLTIML